MLMLLMISSQLESSGPIRHSFPNVAPTGAYQSYHPQRSKKIGLHDEGGERERGRVGREEEEEGKEYLPVLFNASRIVAYSWYASVWFWVA